MLKSEMVVSFSRKHDLYDPVVKIQYCSNEFKKASDRSGQFFMCTSCDNEFCHNIVAVDPRDDSRMHRLL